MRKTHVNNVTDTNDPVAFSRQNPSILARLSYVAKNPVKQFVTHPWTAARGAFVFAQFASRQPETARVINRVRARNLTYLYRENLVDLSDTTAELEAAGIEGAIVEAGCALGGSAIVLAHSKSQERPLKVYDAFGMIPAPSPSDGPDVHRRYAKIASGTSSGIGGDVYYGYRSHLRESVAQALTDFDFDLRSDRIELIEGLFEDTMNLDFPVALVHLDCDWYESVTTCLHAIGPHVVLGGRFVIDDYYGYSGCRRAVDEFLGGSNGRCYEMVHRSRPHMIKKHRG